jgi:RNA-binding protein Nova
VDTQTTTSSSPNLFQTIAESSTLQASLQESAIPSAYTGHPPDIADDYDCAGRYNASTFPSAIKLLVSNNVAGSIIGRSGQTISDLQAQSATRIKLSQSGDYYPGTQDRVCLVQGQPESVKKAVSLLLTRLYALQQQQHYHHFAWQRQEQERAISHDPNYGQMDQHPPLIPAFAFVVQILVPTPCCGMIIGKGGANVKHMVDSSGVSSVRLSPKEGGDQEATYPPTHQGFAQAGPMSTSTERVVSITGPDLNSCLKCLFIALDGMASHPEISRYANMTTSYSRGLSTVSAQNAYDGIQTTTRGLTPRHDVAYSNVNYDSHENLSGLDGSFLERDSPALGFLSPQQRLADTRMYNPMSMSPATFFPQESGAYQQQSPARSPLQSVQNSILYVAQPSYGNAMSASVSAPDLLAMHMQESLRVSEPLAHMDHNTQFAPQIPERTHQPPGFQALLAIPDSLIGSVLGRGGKTLNELQLLSNTRIQISQRGEYMPGTKDRIVTIRGQSAQGVTAAQFLMSQRMVLPPTAVTTPPYIALDYRASYTMAEQAHNNTYLRHPPRTSSEGPTVSSQEHPPS